MIIRLNAKYIVYAVLALLVLFNVFLWKDPVKPRNDEFVLSSLNDTLRAVNKELAAIHDKMLEKKSIVVTTSSTRSVSEPIQSHVEKPKEHVRNSKKKRAVLFTMDSIESYEKNSLSGGAAGK